MDGPAADLHRYPQAARDAVVWKREAPDLLVADLRAFFPRVRP